MYFFPNMGSSLHLMITSQTWNHQFTEPTMKTLYLMAYWLWNVSCYFKWPSNHTPLCLHWQSVFIPISIEKHPCDFDCKPMSLTKLMRSLCFDWNSRTQISPKTVYIHQPAVFPSSLISIKPITTTTTTNFESKQSD